MHVNMLLPPGSRSTFPNHHVINSNIQTSLLYIAIGSFLIAQIHVEAAKSQIKTDTFQENLFIRPLIDGKLFTQFQFKTTYRKDIKSLRWENKFEIFPLSLADLVATADINRLHFSLTKGNWNYRDWSYSTRSSPPGAQVRAVFSQHNENHERSWSRLVNSLAGKFCTSLSSADETTVVASRITFSKLLTIQNSTERVLYANLPEETLCTENLTPWKKLLPCHSKMGLASLLNAVNLLRSSYSSLAIDIEPKPCIVDGQVVSGCESVQLKQTISVVFNPLILFENKQTWSLTKIFGNPIQESCPLASESLVHVDITDLDDRGKLYPQTYTDHDLIIKLDDNSESKRTYATFDVQNLLKKPNSQNSSLARVGPFNVGIKQTSIFKPLAISLRSTVPILFSTHIAGIGSSDGTIVATIRNDHHKPVRVTYMDMVPQFLRVFLHTLSIKTKTGQELKPDKLNYALSQGSSPTLIELSIVIPAQTEARINYDFERAFLRWTDYKPDANKGVLVGSALLAVSPKFSLDHITIPMESVLSGKAKTLEEEMDVFVIYAKPLLFILPTPDFSMPYNVNCMVGTAMVLIFGAIHALTTTKPEVAIPLPNKKKDCNKKDQ